MKRPFFASVALATLITAPAIAADLPRPVPVPPSTLGLPCFRWSSRYGPAATSAAI